MVRRDLQLLLNVVNQEQLIGDPKNSST
jgi:hypothetical protein